MNHRVLNRAIAFSKGKRVMTTISVPNAKAEDPAKYKKLYGSKAVYKKMIPKL